MIAQDNHEPDPIRTEGDANDIGMTQARGRFSLGLESLHGHLAGELPGQNHHHRDDAIQAHLPGLIDHAHAATSNLVQQFVIVEAGPPGRKGAQSFKPGLFFDDRWRIFRRSGEAPFQQATGTGTSHRTFRQRLATLVAESVDFHLGAIDK